MAFKIINRHVEKIDSDGTNYMRVELACDTASELEGLTGVTGTVFTRGSIAWDISTGDFYGYNGETWYKQDGSGAYSAEVTPSVQSLGNGRSIPETKVLVEPDIREDLREEEPKIIPEVIPEEKEEEPEIKEEEKDDKSI